MLAEPETRVRKPPHFIFLIVLLSLTAILPALPQTRKPRSAAQPQSNRGAAPLHAADEAVRLTNLRAAYIGQQRFADALQMVQRAQRPDPGLETPRPASRLPLLHLQR